MKKKGFIIILLGILGTVLVCTFDIMMGKPVNDITGPRSIAALIVCGLLVITGIRLLRKKGQKAQA